MAITLTENAASEIQRVMGVEKIEADNFLRIGVLGGGCSGFGYTMRFDENYDRHVDSKYAFHGVNVVIDKKSALYLDGATVDWSQDGQGFSFDNPNVVRACACGHAPPE